MTTPNTANATTPLPTHNLQAVYEVLRDKVTQLHGCWKLYKQLYTDQTPVATLADAAPSAFSLIQESLAQSLEIGIGGRSTAGAGSSSARHEAASRVAALDQRAAAIIKRRHKRTAHRDLTVALGKVTIDPVTSQLIDEAITGFFARWLGHGTAADVIRREMERAGFRLAQEIDLLRPRQHFLVFEATGVT